MSSLTKLLVLFTAALSVSALATPHVVRTPHGHHALAARMAAPAPSPAVGPYGREVKLVKPKRKRGDTGRCRAQSSSAVSSSTSVEIPSSSLEPVAAAASAPPEASSSSQPSPPPETSTPPPAPEPTPEPTSTQAPEPTPSLPDNNDSDNNNNNSNGNGNSNLGGDLASFLPGTHTGQGTFYDIGLGACGITNSGDDRIAAVSHLLFDQVPGANGNPNQNPICGRHVRVTYEGRSTTVQIVDRCEGCALFDLDFSPNAFSDLADFSVGRLSDITWDWA